jgi:hypothetical protein
MNHSLKPDKSKAAHSGGQSGKSDFAQIPATTPADCPQNGNK